MPRWKAKPPAAPRPAPAIIEEPARYRAWLAHVFERPEHDWYFPSDAMEDVTFPDVTPEEHLRLFVCTLLNSGRDLEEFSEAQVLHGLKYMFSISCSDVIMDVMSLAHPLELSLAAIHAVSTLYTNCFESRCAPVLSHRSDPEANPLNGICYMLWDASPILSWRRHPQEPLLTGAVCHVLEGALSLKNPACIESALHGLGHLIQLKGQGSRAAEIAANFVQSRPLPPALKSYAQAAAAGGVQ